MATSETEAGTPACEFWKSREALGWLTPGGKLWPEGEDFPDFVAKMFTGEAVVDFGCGAGRLAPCFAAWRYIGVDPSPHAVKFAKVYYPGYRFEIDHGEDLPDADVLLAHTVLLHVPDGEIGDVVARFHHPRVVVSEILGRRWRRWGVPPVYNRELGDYIDVFAEHGYRADRLQWRPYPHYKRAKLGILEFRKC